MTPPVIPEMQRLQNNMDKLLYRTDLGEYDKARQYMQLQNRFLAFKQQLNSRSREPNPLYSEEQRESSSNLLPGHVPPLIQELVTAQAAVETPTTIQVTPAQQPMAAQATPAEVSLPSHTPSHSGTDVSLPSHTPSHSGTDVSTKKAKTTSNPATKKLFG